MRNPQQPYDLNDYTPMQAKERPYDLSSPPVRLESRSHTQTPPKRTEPTESPYWKQIRRVRPGRVCSSSS